MTTGLLSCLVWLQCRDLALERLAITFKRGETARAWIEGNNRPACDLK
jgi:hypothetical protein